MASCPASGADSWSSTSRSPSHVGQRLEQHAVDDAEHRGVGADAQAEHQDGDQREARLTPERPRRVAHRARGPIEPQHAALVAAFFAHAVHAAKSRPGAAAAPRRASGLARPGAWPRGRGGTATRCRADRRAAALPPRALPSNPLQHISRVHDHIRGLSNAAIIRLRPLQSESAEPPAAIRSHCAVSSRSWRWPVFVSR